MKLFPLGQAKIVFLLIKKKEVFMFRFSWKEEKRAQNQMIFFFSLIGFCFSLFLNGCVPLLDWRTPNAIDYRPPVLVEWNVVSSHELELLFDEEVEGVKSEEGILLASEGNKLILRREEAMLPGKNYREAIALQDRYKNRLDLVLSFYGYNPDVASLVLSEVRIQGNKSRPDMVELKVVQSGSLAGITFYKGSPTNYDFFYVFPDVKVKEGDWILLHLVPEGISEEINELKHQKQSGGKEASSSAWDFWLKKKENFSGSNGLLVVSSRFGGSVQDLLLYSKGSGEKEDAYGGFGSLSNQLRAVWAVESGGWKIDGETISPADCVNPTHSTATRTLCRNRHCVDTDRAGDWYIVDSGGSSMGKANSEKKYSP